MQIQVELVGLDKLQKRYGTFPSWAGGPLRNALHRAALEIQSEAKRLSPVDTGRLRSSIVTSVSPAGTPIGKLEARTGTNVFYAPYMEFGTGVFAEGEGGKGGRHQPPSAALEVWASRHGMPNGYIVARAIGKHGGLKPRRYLRTGVERARAKMDGFVARAAKEIEEGFARG